MTCHLEHEPWQYSRHHITLRLCEFYSASLAEEALLAALLQSLFNSSIIIEMETAQRLWKLLGNQAHFTVRLMNPTALWEMEYAINLTNVGNECFYAFIDGDQKTAFAGMKGF